METAFHYGLGDKQLQFKLRQAYTAPPGVELKGKGFFNTVTGQLQYTGTLRGGVKVGKDIKGAGSTPLAINVGAIVSDSTSKARLPPNPQINVLAKKRIAVLDGPNTVLSAKAWANLEAQTGKVAARKAVLKISHKWFNFTKRQDLKLSAGIDLDWPLTAREPAVVPFAQVRENNWAVNYRQRKWFVTYDL